ncbi:MAG TPA: amidohydrolase family protein [Planctomycetota bacterium]|nr:amidohydrolase family protein [Planctomycetota bacterium]
MHQASSVCAVLLAAVAAGGAARAQDGRPLAFTNARLCTLEGEVVPLGTLVVRDGRIQALGADAVAPAGALQIDCKGGTIMPGLVSAFARAGIDGPVEGPRQQPGPGRGRRGPPVEINPGPRGGTLNQPATKVSDKLYARQPIFGELLRCGVTTLALTPPGSGLPGLGAVLRPDGKTAEQLVAVDAAFVFVAMVRDTAVKKLLKESFDKAKKVVEERKKPKEPAKPEAKPEDKPADKPAEAKTEPPKGEPPPKPPEPTPPPVPKPDDKKEEKAAAPAPAAKPPEPPKDPNIEVLADLLEGKRRAILELDAAADLLHWLHAVGDDLQFPRAIVVPRYDQQAGAFDVVVEQCKKLKAPILLPPQLSVRPRTRYLTNPALTLQQAGVEVGFVIGDHRDTLRVLFFNLMELVRYGLPADVALKGATLVPAKALGVDGEVGSLKVGKKANLLLFSGDPLDPTSVLQSVWLEGRDVTVEKKGAER